MPHAKRRLLQLFARTTARDRLPTTRGTALHVATRHVELARDGCAVMTRIGTVRPARSFSSVSDPRPRPTRDADGRLALGLFELGRPVRRDTPAAEDRENLGRIAVALHGIASPGPRVIDGGCADCAIGATGFRFRPAERRPLFARLPNQPARLRFLGRGIAASARSAELTDSDVSKTSATSGSSTTTLAMRGSLPAYLPRTAFEKSYSARISSLAGLRLVFFILSSTERGDQRTSVTRRSAASLLRGK